MTAMPASQANYIATEANTSIVWEALGSDYYMRFVARVLFATRDGGEWSISGLAFHMGISRTSVRRAVRMLRVLGVLEDGGIRMSQEGQQFVLMAHKQVMDVACGRRIGIEEKIVRRYEALAGARLNEARRIRLPAPKPPKIKPF